MGVERERMKSNDIKENEVEHVNVTSKKDKGEKMGRDCWSEKRMKK